MKVTFKMIDPELRFKARMFNLLPKIKNEESFRKGMAKGNEFFKFKKPDDVSYEEVLVKRTKNESKLRIVICKPLKPKEKVPGVFWIHGGAFASSSPEQTIPIARRLIAASNAVVVMPAYRLSLEAPYPAGLNDCYEALLWMKAHTGELGIRDDQIMAAGDSSGANMAAAVCMMARDRGDVNIACQIVLYPALDDLTQSESMRDNNSPVIDSTLIKICWKFYLGDLYGGDVPIYAAPARASDFNKLPPAIGFVGGVDPLRDETVAYFRQLEAAGIPVHFQIFEGGYHGFEEFCPKAKISKKAHIFFIEAYRHAVQNYFAPQKSR
jgi:acetyl esterase/lipase